MSNLMFWYKFQANFSYYLLILFCFI